MKEREKRKSGSERGGMEVEPMGFLLCVFPMYHDPGGGIICLFTEPEIEHRGQSERRRERERVKKRER